MGKKIKLILIFTFLLEFLIILFLGFKNFQKIREILDLRLELKTLQEQLYNRETKIKELENQIQELQKNRNELEAKIKELNETNRSLQEKISALKENYDTSTKQYEEQKKELTKKIQELNEENTKTLLSLTGKIEQLLYTKLHLEKELEKIKNEKKEEIPTNNINLEKIVVLPRREASLQETIGKVLSVDTQYNFLIIDLGQNNAIKPGMRFTVLRKDKKIAEIIVKEVYKGMSLAEPIPEKTYFRIRRGDQVVPSK